MKVLLLQLAIGWHQQLTQLTYKRHSTLATRYNYDYKIVTTRTTSRGIYWEKPIAIQQELDNYEYIYYLDADTIWVDNELYQPNTAIAAVQHTDPILHYNAGVLYVNTSKAHAFFQEWLAESDDNHIWQDQYALHKVLTRTPAYVTTISNEWNALHYSETLNHEQPNVVAWHGKNDIALEEMRKYLDRNRLCS